MIYDYSRMGYIGASDTRFVMGNWNTESFALWWRQKQGLDDSHFTSIYTETGSAFEHKITDYLGIFDTDQQVTKGKLRVNLDAIQGDTVIEVKTHKAKPNWTPEKAYIQQVQVQMYITGLRQAKIIAYELEEADYEDWDREIDGDRISFFFYDYDEGFIYDYLPRFHYLVDCMERGVFPKKVEYESNIDRYQSM